MATMGLDVEDGWAENRWNFNFGRTIPLHLVKDITTILLLTLSGLWIALKRLSHFYSGVYLIKHLCYILIFT